MSEIFFRELKIPAPLVNLRARSGSHALQTAVIMRRLEALVTSVRPHLVIVPGDTNTTLAASLTAAKLRVPVAHLEAGLRSGDMTMPEEINRRLADHCSKLLSAPKWTAVSNLRRESLAKLAYLTGDTMVDTLCSVMPILRGREDSVLRGLMLQPREYVLVTLHRPSNVDDPDRLRQIELALNKITTKLRLSVVFPVHPCTRPRLARVSTAKNSGDRLTLTRPKGYVETLCPLREAAYLLTDSGGMQKEAFLLGVPCITLRSTTEWPETLAESANRLVTRPKEIPRTVATVAWNRSLRERIRNLRNPFGDGRASGRIPRVIEEACLERR